MYEPKEIINIQLLSSYLRTSPELLKTFIYGKKILIDWKNKPFVKNLNPESNSKNEIIVQRFYIPKKNKRLGYRVVYKLWKQFTRDTLKVLKFNLYGLYFPSEYIHGFVRGRDTLTNAKSHLGNQFLVKIDIKNFFETISVEKVKEAFKLLGFNEEISIMLSSITTINGILPPGFPTSPLIANIVFSNVDEKIYSLCKEKGATYTRYADDISITSNSNLPSIEELEKIISSYGFSINSQKTKTFKFGQNLYVTGLSIADSKYPRIPKHIKRKLRQELYHINRYGYHSHICHIRGWDEKTDKSITDEIKDKIRNRIKGWIDYINHIEPVVAKKLYNINNQIEEKLLAEKKALFEKNNGRIFTIYESENKKPIPKKK